jgi:hypothetical protein
MRKRRKEGQIYYPTLLISTLEPAQVISMLQLPADRVKKETALMSAYSQLYVEHAGTIEVEIKV